MSTAPKKYGPASRDRLGVQGATPPKLKPAKAGKQPSSSFGPVSPDVSKLLKRANQILRDGGFRLVGDPLNPMGDGRSWVVTCQTTGEMPTGADAANSARQCLESEGVKVDETFVQNDRRFKVALSPPFRSTVELAKSESEKNRTEMLQNIYHYDDVGSRVPSNRAIEEDYIRTHSGPSTEFLLGEAWKIAKTSISIGMKFVPPSSGSESGTELTRDAEKPGWAYGPDGPHGKNRGRRTFRSELRKAVAYYIETNSEASDREILSYLRDSHRKLVPAAWELDEKLSADTFTKVRRAIRSKR